MFADLRSEIGPEEDHDFEFLRGRDTGGQLEELGLGWWIWARVRCSMVQVRRGGLLSVRPYTSAAF